MLKYRRCVQIAAGQLYTRTQAQPSCYAGAMTATRDT